MRQSTLLRSVACVALLGAVAFVVFGCGGGGGPGTPDLYLAKFLLVDQNMNNIGGTGATNAFRDTRILFEFSTAVDPATVSSRTIQIGIPTDDGLFKEATGRFEVVDGHPDWVLFDPTYTANNQTSVQDNPFGLDANSKYEVHIPSALDALKYVKSSAGKGIVLRFDGVFQTTGEYIQDFRQPEMVSTTPTADEKDVSPTSDVLIAFTEAMKPDSFKLNQTFFVRVLNALDDSGQTVTRDVLGTLRFSADAKTVTFRPVFGFGKGRLRFQTDATGQPVKDANGNLVPVLDSDGNAIYDPYEVFVRITTDVTNLPGNPIPREIRFSFFTKPDRAQPEFRDITEEFDTNTNEDTSYTPTFPRAAWNTGVTSGFLAGVFTTGTVTLSQSNNNVTYNPYSWGSSFAAQAQSLYLSGEIGSSRTITGFDWQYANYNSGTTVTQMTVNLGHTTLGNLTSNFTTNYSETPISVVSNLASYTIPSTPSQGWLAGPTFSQNFKYNGSDNLILEILCTNASGTLNTNTSYAGAWFALVPDSLYRNAYNVPGSNPTVQQYNHDVKFHYLIDQSEDQSKWYDSGLLSLPGPQYLDSIEVPATDTQPAGTQTTLEFQGALTDPDNPDQPLIDSASDWTQDLTKLAGFRFIRFRATLKGNILTNQVPSYDQFIFPFIFF